MLPQQADVFNEICCNVFMKKWNFALYQCKNCVSFVLAISHELTIRNYLLTTEYSHRLCLTRWLQSCFLFANGCIERNQLFGTYGKSSPTFLICQRSRFENGTMCMSWILCWYFWLKRKASIDLCLEGTLQITMAMLTTSNNKIILS